MKDLLICFVIALVLGSIWSGMQQGSDSQGAGGESNQSSEGPVAPLASTNDSNFQSEVLDQSQPVLVDFYTQSCPHCKRMAPVLGQVAQQYSRTLKIVKMDIMDNPATSHKYDIGGVPAFLLFDKGKVVASFVGEMPKGKLLSLIKPYLGSPEHS